MQGTEDPRKGQEDPRVFTTTNSVFKFGNKVLASQLRAWVDTLPPTAEITVSKYNGDAREPTETSFTATYPTTLV